MEPIATYRGKYFEGKQALELTPESIRIEGSEFLGTEWEFTVPLADLRPDVSRTRSRGRDHRVALYVSIGAAFASFILIEGFGMKWYSLSAALLWTAALCAAAVAAATRRKQEFASFSRVNGEIVFSVSQSGPDTECYEEFVAAIVAGIRAAEEDDPGTPPKPPANDA